MKKYSLLIWNMFLLLAWTYFGQRSGWENVDIVMATLQAVIVIYYMYKRGE